jgi:hypothetical protein
VLKGHNTLLMHYEATRWDKFSPHQSHINYYFSIQTLTTLNLYVNNIGDEGAQHLAHASKSNAVRKVLSSLITCQLWCFNTDTDHTESSWQQYPCWRCTIPCSCITKQHGERSFPCISHISITTFQCRHWPHWIFLRTISMLQERNTWLMHYKAIRWKKFSRH